MGKTKHTLGPWSAEYTNDTGPDDDFFRQWWDIIGLNGEKIGEAESLNDARLIAAAPELLGALSACLSCLTLDSDLEEDFSAEIAQARAAIAKARGE